MNPIGRFDWPIDSQNAGPAPPVPMPKTNRPDDNCAEFGQALFDHHDDHCLVLDHENATPREFVSGHGLILTLVCMAQMPELLR